MQLLDVLLTHPSIATRLIALKAVHVVYTAVCGFQNNESIQISGNHALSQLSVDPDSLVAMLNTAWCTTA